MPVHDRIRAQAQLILNGHPSAATHPAPDRWDDIDDFDYFYREHAILVRAQDADEVTGGLTRILEAAGYGDIPEGEAREVQREPVSRGLVRLTVSTRLSDREWPGPSIRSMSARIAVPPLNRTWCRPPPWRPFRHPTRVIVSPGPGTTEAESTSASWTPG